MHASLNLVPLTSLSSVSHFHTIRFSLLEYPYEFLAFSRKTDERGRVSLYARIFVNALVRFFNLTHYKISLRLTWTCAHFKTEFSVSSL